MRIFDVTVDNKGELKSSPDKMRVPRGTSENFAVALAEGTESDYALLPLHFEENPRGAATQQRLNPSVILIRDNNEREVGAGQKDEIVKFSIRVRARGGTKELFLDPVIVNE